MVEPERRDLVIGLRMERQHRLTDEEDPLALVAIIEESVLHRPVGPPHVMREQLEHLLTIGEQPNVTILVIPTSAGPHAAIDGAFLLQEFAEFSSAVYLQHHPVIGARYSDDLNLVATYEKLQSRSRTRRWAHKTQRS